MVHRWLGVPLSVLFLLWFASGIGMMYFPFPSVSAADRLERAAALRAETIALSPAQAAAKLGVPIDELRLNTFDARAAYRAGSGRSGGERVLYADTGEEHHEASVELVRRAAAVFTGQPASAATIAELREVDQWTVQVRFDALRPVWKLSWPNGEQVYVSQRSGEVVQHTTTRSRIGAYLGPIPHWIYFTPLRKHGPEWSRLVITSSGLGVVAAILGLVIGVWSYLPARRLPYRGSMLRHAALGLVFGVAAATYAFSGMLSMDPFGRRADRAPDIARALRGSVLAAAYDAKHPREALEQLGSLPVKELELTSFDGEPVYLARLGGGGTRVVPVRGGPSAGFDREAIIRVVTKAARGQVTTRWLERYDRYYLDRERRLPLPVVLAELTGGERARYYIDPRTARVVRSYGPGDWMNRWLYHGLHSLDFPWLYEHRPLWDVVVIGLMLGGTALGATSLLLAWRALGRRLDAARGGPA